jgi:hypothetical protein
MDKDQRKEKIQENICNYLEEGMLEKDAAELSGIDRTTMWRWKAENATFATWVEASIVKYKSKLIHIMNVGAIKKPSIAFKILRTRWPDEWNVKRRVERNSEPDVHVEEIAKNIQKILEEEDEKECNAIGVKMAEVVRH